MPVQMFDGPKKKANLRMNTSSNSTRWFNCKDKRTPSQRSYHPPKLVNMHLTYPSKNATWKVDKNDVSSLNWHPDSLSWPMRQAIRNRNSYYLPSWHMTLRPTFFRDLIRVKIFKWPILDAIGGPWHLHGFCRWTLMIYPWLMTWSRVTCCDIIPKCLCIRCIDSIYPLFSII